MKRKFLILSVLALCFSLFAAETIAYFTADSKAHNVITTGGVQIAVQEWADEERTKPFEDVTGVMPRSHRYQNCGGQKHRRIRRVGAGDGG